MNLPKKENHKRYKIILSGGEFPEEILSREDNNIDVENVNLKLILESISKNKTVSFCERELEEILNSQGETDKLLSDLGININNSNFNNFSPREKFYEILKSLGPGKVKTSQPNISDFTKSLEGISNYDAVVISTISSKLSSTYSTALLSLNKLPESERKNVFVLDSKSVSKIVGLCAYNHLERIINNEAREEFNDYYKEVFMRGLIFDLRYIDIGGRGDVLKPITNLMNTFKIIPLITLQEGKVNLLKIIKGEKKSLIAFKEEVVKELGERKEFYNRAILLYTGKNTRDKLKDVEEILSEKGIYAEYLCSDFVLGTHFGAESFGIFLYKR
ncbi:MAG: DegV family protein [Candidatus Woesearchaeota archaeon]